MRGGRHVEAAIPLAGVVNLRNHELNTRSTLRKYVVALFECVAYKAVDPSKDPRILNAV